MSDRLWFAYIHTFNKGKIMNINNTFWCFSQRILLNDQDMRSIERWFQWWDDKNSKNAIQPPSLVTRAHTNTHTQTPLHTQTQIHPRLHPLLCCSLTLNYHMLWVLHEAQHLQYCTSKREGRETCRKTLCLSPSPCSRVFYAHCPGPISLGIQDAR